MNSIFTINVVPEGEKTLQVWWKPLVYINQYSNLTYCIHFQPPCLKGVSSILNEKLPLPNFDRELTEPQTIICNFVGQISKYRYFWNFFEIENQIERKKIKPPNVMQ